MGGASESTSGTTHADGRGLRHALDFLVPFAAGEREWTIRKSPLRAGRDPALLRRAAVAWKEPKYESSRGLEA